MRGRVGVHGGREVGGPKIFITECGQLKGKEKWDRMRCEVGASIASFIFKWFRSQ